jgi:hypothetical protein
MKRLDDVAKLLTEYTQYLYEFGYLDDDWIMEAPSPIQEFINKKFGNVVDGLNKTTSIKLNDKIITDVLLAYGIKISSDSLGEIKKKLKDKYEVKL